MKLDPIQIVLFHRRRESTTVLAFRRGCRQQRDAIRVREIHESSVSHSLQQARCTTTYREAVPAHMRRLYSRREATALARPQPKSMNVRRLFARCEHPLHTHANSKEGNSAFDTADYGVS